MKPFQSGDIICVHAKGFSWLRLITGMYYNHVLIVDERIFDDYATLESISKGVSPTLLSNYKGQEIAVFRYKGITPAQRESVRLAARRLGCSKYDFLLPFRVAKQVGLRGVWKLLIQLWTKQYPLDVPHHKDSFMVCSEFAQESYSAAGLPILPDDKLLVPDAVPLLDKLECVYRGIW